MNGMNGGTTMDDDTSTHRNNPYGQRTASAGADESKQPALGLGLAEAEAALRTMVESYPLLTLAGAVVGGYLAARVLRRVR